MRGPVRIDGAHMSSIFWVQQCFAARFWERRWWILIQKVKARVSSNSKSIPLCHIRQLNLIYKINFQIYEIFTCYYRFTKFWFRKKKNDFSTFAFSEIGLQTSRIQECFRTPSTRVLSLESSLQVGRRTWINNLYLQRNSASIAWSQRRLSVSLYDLSDKRDCRS